MTSVSRSKPKPGEFEIEYQRGRGWFVIAPDGTTDERSFANRNAALSARGWAKAKGAQASRASERPCMTCRKPFLSEGPHHRMCTGCRHNSPGEPSQSPYITRRG